MRPNDILIIGMLVGLLVVSFEAMAIADRSQTKCVNHQVYFYGGLKTDDNNKPIYCKE